MDDGWGSQTLAMATEVKVWRWRNCLHRQCIYRNPSTNILCLCMFLLALLSLSSVYPHYVPSSCFLLLNSRLCVFSLALGSIGFLHFLVCQKERKLLL